MDKTPGRACGGSRGRLPTSRFHRSLALKLQKFSEYPVIAPGLPPPLVRVSIKGGTAFLAQRLVWGRLWPKERGLAPDDKVQLSTATPARHPWSVAMFREVLTGLRCRSSRRERSLREKVGSGGPWGGADRFDSIRLVCRWLGSKDHWYTSCFVKCVQTTSPVQSRIRDLKAGEKQIERGDGASRLGFGGKT